MGCKTDSGTTIVKTEPAWIFHKCVTAYLVTSKYIIEWHWAVQTTPARASSASITRKGIYSLRFDCSIAANQVSWSQDAIAYTLFKFCRLVYKERLIYLLNFLNKIWALEHWRQPHIFLVHLANLVCLHLWQIDSRRPHFLDLNFSFARSAERGENVLRSLSDIFPNDIWEV